MLVYGDLSVPESPTEKRARIVETAREAAAMAPGVARHGAVAAAFIEAGELAQGVADAAFTERGCNARTPAQDAAMALLVDLARTLSLSWESGFRRIAPLSDAALQGQAAFPESIRVKRPEGYAFYALYPEAYLEAAAGLGPQREPVTVIGIRSIGTGLAALVAAALGAPAPVTVRPVGHPFRREIALAPDHAAALLAHPEARFAVVDEGPGLSGSSFGAVADFLEDHGVAPERIRFFPSHGGALGPQASPRHRARWSRAQRHVVDFDALVLRARNPAHRLETWADAVGEPVGALEDISGGAWRFRAYACEAGWPPAHAHQERRKFILRTEAGPWLLKFVGLGREGARKLDRARALHAAGFTPAAAGYRHGFLIERWIEAARPIDLRTVDRDVLIAFAGRYLGFRARTFDAGPERGASLDHLLHMARINSAQAFGEAWARHLDRFASETARLEQRVRRIETDNRLHAWEWLRDHNGRLLKTDALDHCAAHDLVGCQDVAWDVAGAIVELGLSDDEEEKLCAIVAHETGRAVDPDLLAFCLPCYLAFQMGSYALAADALQGWPEEAARLRAASHRYAGRLRDVLTACD